MIRIAITGPESSGKTTLARELSLHFNTNFVEEYARTYLNENGQKYDQFDIEEIAQNQLKNTLESQNSINIIDTDFVVLKIWSEWKYNFASPFINEQVSKNIFDLHILCAPDIPWEEDHLRENQHDRHELFGKYIATLELYKKDFIIVNGSIQNRLEKSLKAINSKLN